jgi:hypothetical protein
MNTLSRVLKAVNCGIGKNIGYIFAVY